MVEWEKLELRFPTAAESRGELRGGYLNELWRRQRAVGALVLVLAVQVAE